MNFKSLINFFILKFESWGWKNPKPYIYFETSAINHLHQVLSFQEAEALSKFVAIKGNHYRVSSLVFWEVLLTADDIERESLVLFLQHFVPYPPIAAPEELIIKWLRQGCPLVEPRRRIETQTQISKTWEDIYSDKRKTFVLDRHQLAERLNLLRKLGHSLRRAVLHPKEKDNLLGIVIMDVIDPLVRNLNFLKNTDEVSEDELNLYRISTFFVLMIFCVNLSLENEIVDAFWKNESIADDTNKLIYFLKKYETAIYRGPLATMAKMALHQITKKKSRGLWADCLHSVYIPYSDCFLSADAHFYSLVGTDPHFDKISNIKIFDGFKHTQS